jgi:NSS family neurotransmitter:Na+ symporter
MFFALFFFAAITSAIAILETVVAYFVERGQHSRRQITIRLTAVYWTLGLVSVLSFNHWAGARPLAFIPAFKDVAPGGIIDGLVANVFLLLTGALVAIWVGWFLAKDDVAAELGIGQGRLFHLWRFLMRFVAPGAVITLFVANLL